MIGVLDVGYIDDTAVVGCLTLAKYEDERANREWSIRAGEVDPYVSGQFWRRELEPLLRALSIVPEVSVVVIDAYVDLGPDQVPGLGRLLHERIDKPVIGVAKSRYEGTPTECEVLRGQSKRPLYVTAAGLRHDLAKEAVFSMAGSGRVPTMIRRADQLSRVEPGSCVSRQA